MCLHDLVFVRPPAARSRQSDDRDLTGDDECWLVTANNLRIENRVNVLHGRSNNFNLQSVLKSRDFPDVSCYVLLGMCNLRVPLLNYFQTYGSLCCFQPDVA